MNKYCDILGTLKTYSEAVSRTLKHFNVFEPPFMLRMPAAFTYSISVTKIIFTIHLIFNRKKTANGVIFRIIQSTKQSLQLTKQN